MSTLKDFPLRSLARITLQLTSPLHVGTGRGEAEADAGFVRDANGLPFIPGSSIIGRLRRLVGKADCTVESPFGHQLRNQGLGSRILISNAVVHDQNNRPRDGIVPASDLQSDRVLRSASTARLRDHVRLTEQGAAADKGKFDDLSVAAGHRFTFELEFIHTETPEDGAFWNALLAALRSPLFRLGGKTRRGFGGVSVIEIKQACLDLRESDDFEAYRTHPASLSNPALALKHDGPTSSTSTAPDDLSLDLIPNSFWMFGGGTDAEADAAPVRDEVVTWDDQHKPTVQTRWVIPFSGVKGALSHRTLFHARAAAEAWEAGTKEEDAALVAHAAIFGQMKDNNDPDARPGRLFGDDVWLGPAENDLSDTVLQHHVGIDRLTGGASDTALFTDKPLWRNRELVDTGLHIPLYLETPAKPDADFTAGRTALEKALDDLREGRLALGGLTGRGYGRYSGYSPQGEAILHANAAERHNPALAIV